MKRIRREKKTTRVVEMELTDEDLISFIFDDLPFSNGIRNRESVSILFKEFLSLKKDEIISDVTLGPLIIRIVIENRE